MISAEAFEYKEQYQIQDLIRIVEILRSENGCPWDREQNHMSIRMDLLEEAYEAYEALVTEDRELLREELGDVLLQVALHAQIDREAGGFDFDAVCDGICKKLILRHPHVFGDGKAGNAEEVLQNWDQIKQQSKGQTTVGETLRSVPKVFPALMRAQKVQKRAAKAGAVPMELSDVTAEILVRADKLRRAASQSDPTGAAEDLGNLLFSAAAAARLLGLQAEEALGQATEVFIARFEQAEREAAQKAR